MDSALISIEALKEGQKILKPNFHMNYGKRRIAEMEKNNYKIESLGKLSQSVYSGGIFKRIFVPNPNFGIPYISAQHMMNANPVEFSKLISRKFTPRQEDMTLKTGQILVSCAGTIGNVRYITSDLDGVIGSQDIIRVIPNNDKIKPGYIYAFLSSPTAYSYIQSFIYGSVVPRIDPNTLSNLPVPLLDSDRQTQIHNLIVEACNLRVEANKLIQLAQNTLKEEAKLSKLKINEFEYFGHYSISREVSTFLRNRRQITSCTINAFNYSERITNIIRKILEKNSTRDLKSILINNDVFSTGAFPRIELNSKKSILLINQSDIFSIKLSGKLIAKHKVKINNLVDYGEVLIAGVGTLGENETFCRVIYAGDELKGKLVSGEFLRLKTIEEVPSGYLFTWLSSDYGFRLIRSTQTGTKLCRPIQELLLKIPIPILGKEVMHSIDQIIQNAHKKRYLAALKEQEAISIIENEIESWQN